MDMKKKKITKIAIDNNTVAIIIKFQRKYTLCNAEMIWLFAKNDWRTTFNIKSHASNGAWLVAYSETQFPLHFPTHSEFLRTLFCRESVVYNARCAV